jgi:hypothetical protein
VIDPILLWQRTRTDARPHAMKTFRAMRPVLPNTDPGFQTADDARVVDGWSVAETE